MIKGLPSYRNLLQDDLLLYMEDQVQHLEKDRGDYSIYAAASLYLEGAYAHHQHLQPQDPSVIKPCSTASAFGTCQP